MTTSIVCAIAIVASMVSVYATRYEPLGIVAAAHDPAWLNLNLVVFQREKFSASRGGE